MNWRYSPYVLKRPFNKYEAWIDLLMLASHKDHLYGEVWVKRGDVLTSQKKLAERWRWDRKKVRNFLRSLQSHGEIVSQTCADFAQLTICGYDTYQGSSPPFPHQLPTIKKGKKGKKKEELVKEKTDSLCFPSNRHDDYEIQQQLKCRKESI
jgi:hypothetical protein